MTMSHAPVDDLINDLGAARVEADLVQVDYVTRRIIEDAFQQATRAVVEVIRQPDSPVAISAARDALRRTTHLVASLDSEFARSRRNQSVAIGLRLDGQARRNS